MYDAIVVGARCAGSPLAMLLARKGYKVLLLDKSSFPSDTVSTHHIHQPGVRRLQRWGLLDKVKASNCPATRKLRFDVGPFALVGAPPPAGEIAEAYAPRRRVLDQILVDAAVEAGAELREKFTVEELTFDGATVTGICGHDEKGRTFTESTRMVIGADGARSLVADKVAAPVSLDKGMLSCNYYSYWSGVPLEGAELYPRAGRMFVVDKTNDDLTIVVVVWPKDEFQRVRSNIEPEFMGEIREHAPVLLERIEAGRREERFAGAGFLPNFLRKPYGSGWALVGDAGYHKDPLTAQGITNSFSHAEMLAEALDKGFSGSQDMALALAEYETKRDEEVMPMFEHTCQLAKLEQPPAERLQLFNALRGREEDIGRMLGTITGTFPIHEFFSAENIGRIVGAPSLTTAA